jgi:NAD(P)H-nitrite reductase large subunit
VSADSVILATGARERPRAARLVPGDRGDGVFTTGQLQQWTYEHHLPVGHRAVVVGAEHVSYSAVLTLRHAGVRTVAMITDLAHQQSYPMFAALTRRGLRVPLLTEVEVAAIRGHGRVQAIDLRNVVTGATSSIDADTIVFTGDWIPDHELARAAGASIDAGSKGPVVDLDGATSVDDVYAAGNLVHPAETADIVALRARQVGAAVAHHLGGRTPARPAVDIVVAAPLQWAAPGRIVPLAGIPARGDALGLVLRTSEARRSPTVVIAQGGRQLARFRVRAAIPNRSLRVPIGWSALVRPDAGAVTVSLE